MTTREFEEGDRAAEWAVERGYYVSRVGGIAYVPLDDLEHLLADAVADKLDAERLARAIDRVWPNPYAAVMAGQIAGEYEVDDGWREGQPEFNGSFG